MHAAGFTLLVMGLGSVLLAAAIRGLVERPPLPPNPRASEKELAEARRAAVEIKTIIVPWTRKLGLIAAVVGLLLIVMGAI